MRKRPTMNVGCAESFARPTQSGELLPLRHPGDLRSVVSEPRSGLLLQHSKLSDVHEGYADYPFRFYEDRGAIIPPDGCDAGDTPSERLPMPGTEQSREVLPAHNPPRRSAS